MPGGGLGDIDDASLDEGTAIIDPHHHGLAVARIGDFDAGVPKRSRGCAAVSLAGSMRSPDAVIDVSAYQEARPQEGSAAAAAGLTALTARMEETISVLAQLRVLLKFIPRSLSE